MERRITIRDVAERAKVGTMTVSRVVNRSGYVNEQTRTRVEAAIAELGYMPNESARNLRSRRSGTIALIVTDITNPFFTTIARGVEDAASEAGSLVLLGNTDESEAEELRYMRMLVQKGVDGVLFVPARNGATALEFTRTHGLRVVVLDRRSDFAGVDVVRCDSEVGAFELGQLLLNLGHQQFAILAGPEGISTSDDRVTGFLRALKTAGRAANCTISHGQFSVADGAQQMEVALATKPTAVFATNNFLAIGALNYVREAGIRVPEDVALVGFDDLPAHLITFPFLTVSAQPAYEMGVTATKLLLERVQTPDLAAREIVLPTNLVIRTSSGKPIALR
jgi:LacI family transcriptional regulator